MPMSADEATKTLIQFYTLSDAPLRGPEWDALQDFSEEVALAFAVLAEVETESRGATARGSMRNTAKLLAREFLAHARAAITDPEEADDEHTR